MVNKCRMFHNKRQNPVSKEVNTYLHGYISYCNHACHTSHGLQSIILMLAKALAWELPSTNLKKTAYFYMFGDVFLTMVLIC